MVPLKGVLVRSSKSTPAADGERSAAAKAEGEVARGGTPPPIEERGKQIAQLAVVGCAAGFASGMFGIGGGVILTPALCLLTEMPHACVLGTTLASMVPPSLVSAGTHAQMGNVVTSVVVPLVAGSAIGAFASGQVALKMPEEPLQWGFAVFCLAMGGHKLWSLRGKV